MKYILSAATLANVALASTTILDASSHRYDYVVVGGGTSGLVVANRLSENPKVKVAIIEAGGDELTNTNVTNPSGYGLAFGTAIDWQYESVPQVYADGRAQVMRAAKAIGGTSDINGMTYLRAEKAQIDMWEQIGNKGWNWDTLMKYYKKSEQFQVPTEDQISDGASYDPAVHGLDGYLKVGWQNDFGNEESLVVATETFAKVGLDFNTDPNNGTMRGFTINPKTVDRTLNVREDAGRAYYWSVANRTNLHMYTNAFAERMTWAKATNGSKPTVNGVIFTQNGTTLSLSVKKEVILSAGSLRSPLILEQSGVGNPTILKKAGIDVKVNLPTVGENLQDQTTTDIAFSASNSTNTGVFIGYFTAEDVFGNQTAAVAQRISSSLQSYADRTANASGIINANVTKQFFERQYDLIFNKKLPISEILVMPSASSLAIEFWGLLPLSRGSIHINSANASAPATIDPNYFMLEWDSDQQVATAKMARKIAFTAPLSNHTIDATTPSFEAVPANATNAEWDTWLKSTYRSNFHYISTAAMLPQELGGVVDSNLLVYGTKNVRVVDASIIPFQVCGHLTSTLYAVAERASDIIKQKH